MKINEYEISEETYIKAQILTRGVCFSDDAIKVAIKENAKGQNLVYNMPINATNSRPQELIVTNVKDGYNTVVSCVAPHADCSPINIDINSEGKLIAIDEGVIIENVEIHFVEEPRYYKKKLHNGEYVKKYVSACGLDELNILPWKGCAISKGCRFCGVNNFTKKDEISAFTFFRDRTFWKQYKEEYLTNLKEAIVLAQEDTCYNEHMHVILIAGNLSDDQLDLEANIFSDIAREVAPILTEKASEGIVLVITPPKNIALISKLKESDVSKVVFNMEAINKEYYTKYCPGKAALGYDFFVERLEEAVRVFGKGNAWSNLVFGLEPKEQTLELCEQFAKKGIVISANILHLDKGNSLDCKVPSAYDAVDFFYRLEQINNSYGYLPYYCAKALRTSLSNEAHDQRIRR